MVHWLGDFPGGTVIKNHLPMQKRQVIQEMWVWSLDQKDPLKEEIATPSRILVWKIPWTEEPGGLQSMQSMGSQTVRHDWMAEHACQWVGICTFTTKGLSSVSELRDWTKIPPATSYSQKKKKKKKVYYTFLNGPIVPEGFPVSSVVKKWVAISYSTGSYWPRERTCISWVSCIGRQIFNH